MVKRLSIILTVIIGLVIAAELAMPWLVGGLIARGMTGATGSDRVSADVAKRPAILMLGGSFDSVRIRAADARVDKITFADLDATLQGVALDMGALLGSRQVVIKTVRNIDLVAVITQEELSRYLNQSVKGIKNAVVQVQGGKVQINSSFSIGQIASIAITLDGRIVGDGQHIKFVTERFLLNNTAVGNIGGAVLTEIQLVDLRKLPFGVKARQVSMGDGKVTILADNRTP